MTTTGHTVMAVKSIETPDGVLIVAGTEGTVTRTSLFGVPKEVKFALQGETGERDVVVEVGHGDVI